jgi:hypothetical protein
MSVVGCAVVLLAAATASPAEPLTAREIIRRSDDLLRGSNSYARVTMDITRPRWSRSLTLDAWTQGASNAFIRVVAPKKDRGVTFMKRGREAWQFVPAIDRVIKIPPSMMLQSWMGSDFTNDDIVRADSIVTDYEHVVVATNADHWVIDAIAKPDAPVVWGKVTFRVDRTNYVPRHVEYRDEEGELVKYSDTADIKVVEGVELATRFTMVDVTRPGYKTVVRYEALTFKPELPAEGFDLRRLRR